MGNFYKANQLQNPSFGGSASAMSQAVRGQQEALGNIGKSFDRFVHSSADRYKKEQKSTKLQQIMKDASLKQDSGRLSAQETASEAYNKDYTALENSKGFNSWSPEQQDTARKGLVNKHFSDDKVDAMRLVPEDNLYKQRQAIQTGMQSDPGMFSDRDIASRMSVIDSGIKASASEHDYNRKLEEEGRVDRKRALHKGSQDAMAGTKSRFTELSNETDINNLYAKRADMQKELDGMNLTAEDRKAMQERLDSQFKTSNNRLAMIRKNKTNDLVNDKTNLQIKNAEFQGRENEFKLQKRKENDLEIKNVQNQLANIGTQKEDPRSTENKNILKQRVDSLKTNSIPSVEGSIQRIKADLANPAYASKKADLERSLELQEKALNTYKQQAVNEENRLKNYKPTMIDKSTAEQFNDNIMTIYNSRLDTDTKKKKMEEVYKAFGVPASLAKSGKLDEMGKWIQNKRSAEDRLLQIRNNGKPLPSEESGQKKRKELLKDVTENMGAKDIAKIADREAKKRDKKKSGYTRLYLSKDDKPLSQEEIDKNVDKFIRKIDVGTEGNLMFKDDKELTDQFFSEPILKLIAEKNISAEEINGWIKDAGKDKEWKTVIEDVLYPKITGKAVDWFEYGDYEPN